MTQFATLHYSPPGSTIATGINTHVAWGMGCAGSWNTTEANCQRPIQNAGTISHLYAYAPTNTADQTITIRIRINTANGNSVITYTAAATGVQEDTTHTDSVAAGDVVNYRATSAGGTGALTISALATLFTATTNTPTHIINGRPAGRAFSADSTDNFPAVAGDIATGGTENDERIKLRAAMTVANLTVRATANTRATATTLRVRKNGVNGNGVCSIGAGSSTLVQDTTHTDSFAVDDYFGYMLSTSTGGGSITISLLACDFISTAGMACAIGGGAITGNQGTTAYIQLAGSAAAGSTEANSSVKMGTACTLSNFAVYITANTVNADSTFRIRVNSTNGNQVVTFATTVTGYAEDTTHTDAVTANDLVCVRRDVGAGGTSITQRTFATLLNYAAPPAGRGFAHVLNPSPSAVAHSGRRPHR